MNGRVSHHDLSKPTEIFHPFTGAVVILLVAYFSQVTFCSPSRLANDYYDFSTEPPDIVEIFNPQEWMGKDKMTEQIEIQALKIVTQVKLRYARTRIVINLKNPHDKGHQTDFKIVLPESAFFTIFQIRKGNSAKTYSAEIVKKDAARNIYHFAVTKTNGTVSAGYIELSPRKVRGLPAYNLKFTVAASESIQAFLVYERQLERVSNVYTDKIQVFPSNPLFLNSSTIGHVEFAVHVEELEEIQWLSCTAETEENFSNCSSRVRNKFKPTGAMHKIMELSWRDRAIPADLLQHHPFQFVYELEQQNDTTTAVVISQHNGNYYFIHLFVPENLPPTRKHILFLLDVSDSMYGTKLQQLQWSMIEILDDLAPHDFFNIVTFSNNVTVWSKFRGVTSNCNFPFPATEEFKESAIHFVREKLDAQGTTNIYLGLSTAFDLIRLFSPRSNDTCPYMQRIKSLKTSREKVREKLPENVESMIFFLSDGKATSGPTDSASLLKYFHNLNHDDSIGDGERPTLQIHTIAYGEDADVDFLKALSSMNEGVTKVIMEESGAGIELTNFYHEITSQVMSQIQTSVTATNNGTTLSTHITSPVTVIKGGEVLSTGELFPNNDNQSLSFDTLHYNWSTEGIGKNGKLAYFNSPVYDCTSLELSIGRCVERIDFYLERLQAYQLLKKLLERDEFVEQGYICPQAYHEQFQDLVKLERLMDARYEEGEENADCVNFYRYQATELALKYGFLTPYTSFILTTEKVDRGLRSGRKPIPDTASSDEDSAETAHLPPPQGPQEKLILMGQVSSGGKHKISTPRPGSNVKLEILPSASRLVSEMTENNDQNLDSLATANATNDTKVLNTNATIDSKGKEKGFTERIRDFSLQIFSGMFRPKKKPTT